MLSKGMKIASVLVLGATTPLFVGCACVRSSCGVKTACAKTSFSAKHEATAGLPSNAVPGECYAIVFSPPKFETVTERVCVKEASERVEITPAQYEWVNEQVCVKEASTQLEEVAAVYESQEKTVQMNPGHTGWIKETSARCASQNGQPVRDIFCLVSSPPTVNTVRTQCLVKPASVREITIPAQFETVRRQKLVCPATARKISISAEYQDVQKTVATGPGKMEWQRVLCEIDLTTEKANAVKNALLAAGYKAGPLNGKLAEQDWAAINSFQERKGLGIGELSYATLGELGIAAK